MTTTTPHKSDTVNRHANDVARFDFVIVGAGTAGSVLAARLTEQPDVRVLLLEGGPADGPERMSAPAVWPTLIGSEVDWRYSTVPQPGLAGAAIPYPSGRVLGGSSAINAMFHQRGHRSAIDSWAAAGATGWSYDALLPYFRRSERTPRRAPRSAGPRLPGLGGPERGSGRGGGLERGHNQRRRAPVRRRRVSPAPAGPPQPDRGHQRARQPARDHKRKVHRRRVHARRDRAA